MDGGKSGVLSLLILVVVLIVSLLNVWQKDRTEDKVKRMNESLTNLEEEMKKNIRDVAAIKGAFVSMKDNFTETRRNIKESETSLRVLSADVKQSTKQMSELRKGVSRLGDEMKKLEIRAVTAGERRSGSRKKPDDGAGKKPDDGAGKKPDDGAGKKPDDGAGKKPDDGAGKKPEEKPEDEGTGETVVLNPGRTFGPAGPSKEDVASLWKADEKGVIRPVVNDYTGTDYNPFRDGGTLMAMLGTDPKGFNPLTENSSDVSYLSGYCIPFLCQRLRSRPEIWVYDLAEAAEISNDYKTYTFRIRRGVYWQKPDVDYGDTKFHWLKSADREVTAADFKFNYDLIMNPQVQCAHTRNYYQDIEKFEIIDRYTFRVHWKRKVYNSVWVSLGMAPIPKFLYSRNDNGDRFPAESLGLEFNEHWYNNKILGCGQFHFGEWKKGVSVSLVKNPDYYGRQTNLERIVYRIIRDDNQALLKVKNKEVFTSALRYSQYKQEVLEKGEESMFYRRGEEPQGKQEIVYDFYQAFGYRYLGWNLDNPKFKDRRVREALTYACPRKRILKDVFLGLGSIVTGPIYYHHSYYNKRCKPRPFDLDKAKALLAQAGWGDSDGNGILDKVIDGKQVEFKFNLLIYGSSKEWQTLADLYKEELRKVGILLNAEPLDWALMQKKMESREFDCYTGGWALGWEVDPYQIWHSKMADTPKSSNMVAFRNKEADEMIERGRVTFDEEERKKLFQGFHKLLYDEQPYTFLFCQSAIPVWWPHLKNVTFSLIRPQNYKGRWYLGE